MEYPQRLDIIRKNIAKSSKVRKYDLSQEKEAERLSYSFLDIEESLKTISEKLLPKLLDNNINEEEVEDVLLDVGEELRHVLYHIKDNKFYNYLFEDSDSTVI